MLLAFVISGKYGGTYAHKDIAFEFGSAISPMFKIYLIKEFQRLKTDENERLNLEWDLQRTLSKVNYTIHTDAIKEMLLPPELTKKQTGMVYASEADLLNMALTIPVCFFVSSGGSSISLIASVCME